MAKKNISAVVNIGGALSGSVKNTFNFLNKSLTNVSEKIKTVKERQKELEAQRNTYIKQGRSVAKLDREYKKLSGTLSKLEAKQTRLVALSKALGKTKASIGRAFSSITTGARTAGIAIGAMGAGIFALTNSTATLGDNAIKMAGTIGINVERLQGLQYAAERSGASTETLNTSIQSFSRRLGDATKGTGSAVKVLQELGLKSKDLANMPLEQAIGLVSEKIKNLKTDTEKTTAAYNLFGRQGINLINMLNEGSDGLKALDKEALKVGYTLSKRATKDAATFKDSLLNLESSVRGVQNTIGSQLMPVITTFMDKITIWLSNNRKKVKQWTTTFIKGFFDILPSLKNFISGLGSAFKVITSLIKTTASLVGGFHNFGLLLAGIFSASQIAAIASLTKNLISLGVAMAGAFGPVGLIITGISIAVVAIYKNWDRIKKLIFSIWDKIKSFGSGVLNFFGFGDNTPDKTKNNKLNLPNKTAQQNNSTIHNDHSTTIINTHKDQNPEDIAEALKQKKNEDNQNNLISGVELYA